MNRNETKLLVENWRKVLDEGLYDSDSEILLSEGFLQDISSKIGSSVTKGLATLVAFGAAHIADIDPGNAFPQKPAYTKNLKIVNDDLVQKYGEKFIEVQEKYKDVMKNIVVNKILEILYQMHKEGMESLDLEKTSKLSKVLKEIQEKIEQNDKKKYFLPIEEFDKLASKHEKWFDAAADAAKFHINDEVLDVEGAKLIKLTNFSE